MSTMRGPRKLYRHMTSHSQRQPHLEGARGARLARVLQGKSGRRRLERGAVVLAVFLPLRLWYGARQEQRRLIRRHLEPRAAHARPVQSRHRTAAEHA